MALGGSSGSGGDEVLLEIKTRTKAAEDGFRTVRKVATDEFGKIRETIIKTNVLTGESFKTITERGEKLGEQLSDLARKNQNFLIAAAVAAKVAKEAYELALEAAKKSNTEAGREFVRTHEQLKAQWAQVKQDIGESLIIPMQAANDQLRIALGIVGDIARNFRNFITSDYTEGGAVFYDNVGAGIQDMYARAKAYQVGPKARIDRTLGMGQGAAFGTSMLAGGGALPVEVVKVRAGAAAGGSLFGAGAAAGAFGNQQRLLAEAAGRQAGDQYLAASREASRSQATLDELAQVGQGAGWEAAGKSLDSTIAQFEAANAGRQNLLFGIFGTPQDLAAIAGGLTEIEQAAIAAAPAFTVLQSAVTAAFTAWIDGQGGYLKAIHAAIAGALRAVAIQSGVEALKNTALGIAALANPAAAAASGTSAAGFFAAAKMHAAVAVAAGVGAKLLGGAGAPSDFGAAASGGGIGGGVGYAGGSGSGYLEAREGRKKKDGDTYITVIADDSMFDESPRRRQAIFANALRRTGAFTGNEGGGPY